MANPGLVTIDLLGNPATNGQYLFPMGIGLGGIEPVGFVEVNPGLTGTPFSFSGIPWNLDRGLSPNGCIGPCESTPQPLDPFSFEGLDPRTQAANVVFAGAGVPSGTYNDQTFTASPLSKASNRILSFVDPAIGNFNGDKTILAWPPANPPAQSIVQTAGSVTAPGTPTGVTATVTSPTQATVSWTAPAANGGSAITGYLVTALVNGVLPKPPISVFVAAPATSASVGGLPMGTLAAPQAYQFQVRACSSPTTCSTWAIGSKFTVTPVDDTVAANVAFRGSWPVATVAGAYGGSVRAASAAGPNATLSGLTWTHVGSVAWVSTLGPDRGIATVSIDGGAPVTVDLFAPTQQPAQVVFALNGLSPGSHTVVVTAQGTRNPASRGNRVDVDAFVAIL